MTILSNYPLVSALAAIVLAQGAKVPLVWLLRGRWNPALAFGTGGMPSSHSAAVAALATAVGLERGFGSAGFAIAAVVCAITMYDAAGIRRHAGIQAGAINRIVEALKEHLPAACDPERQPLKELLGHRPAEVLGGAIFGMSVGVAFHFVY